MIVNRRKLINAGVYSTLCYSFFRCSNSFALSANRPSNWCLLSGFSPDMAYGSQNSTNDGKHFLTYKSSDNFGQVLPVEDPIHKIEISASKGRFLALSKPGRTFYLGSWTGEQWNLEQIQVSESNKSSGHGLICNNDRTYIVGEHSGTDKESSLTLRSVQDHSIMAKIDRIGRDCHDIVQGVGNSCWVASLDGDGSSLYQVDYEKNKIVDRIHLANPEQYLRHFIFWGANKILAGTKVNPAMRTDRKSAELLYYTAGKLEKIWKLPQVLRDQHGETIQFLSLSSDPDSQIAAITSEGNDLLLIINLQTKNLLHHFHIKDLTGVAYDLRSQKFLVNTKAGHLFSVSPRDFECSLISRYNKTSGIHLTVA